MNFTVSTGKAHSYHSTEALNASPGSVSSFLRALKECGISRELETGRILHSQAFENGFISNLYVANTLISMYGKCGSMLDAQRVFNEAPRRTVVSWNCLLQGFVENGLNESALEHFYRLERGGCSPDSVTYVHALGACAALAEKRNGASERWLQEGTVIYSAATRNGCCNTFVENMVMLLFSRCGRMVQARDVFNKMIKRDVVSWNTLLQGYVENGDPELALEAFDRMDVAPNARTYLAAIRACSRLVSGENSEHWLERGKKLHSQAEVNGCLDVYVGSTLVDFYGRSRELLRARALFEKMNPRRNVVTWNCLLQGYVDNGDTNGALELFERMQAPGEDCCPDARTYIIALSAVADAQEDDRLQHAGECLREVWEAG